MRYTEPRCIRMDGISNRRSEMKTVLPSVIDPSFEGNAGQCRSFVESRCRAPFGQFDFATGKM